MAKREGYISWDEFFMGAAMLCAERSKDPNTQVGACIVDPNGGAITNNLIHLPTGDIYFQPTINLNQSTIILNAYNNDGTPYTGTNWTNSNQPFYKEGDNTLVTIEATEVTLNGETNNTVQVYYPHMNDGKLELSMTNTQKATINIKNEAIIKVQVTYADSEEPEVITVTG